MSFSRIKLPACERCRKRKIKCDGAPPKCGRCSKSNVACIILDPVTNERYTRSAIYDLEKRLDFLESQRSRTSQASTSPAQASPTSTRQSRANEGFVGDGSGLGLVVPSLLHHASTYHRAGYSDVFRQVQMLPLGERVSQRGSFSLTCQTCHCL
jgi:hypothetical protein